MQKTKRADQLVPGDVIVVREPGTPGTDIQPTCYNLVMLCRLGPDLGNDGIRFGDTRPDARQHSTIRYLRPGDEVELARANQEVSNVELDHLLTGACMLIDSGAPVSGILQDVVGRLRPPAPPTLEEALALLAEARANQSVAGFADLFGRTDELLERARRAGVL